MKEVRVVLRQDHDEIMQSGFSAKCYAEKRKEAELIAGLSDKVQVELSPMEHSQTDYEVLIIYKDRKFRVNTYKNIFRCYLNRRFTDKYRNEAIEKIGKLREYSFDKLTEKKLLEKLDHELQVFETADSAYEAKHAEQKALYEQAVEKLMYIGEALGAKVILSGNGCGEETCSLDRNPVTSPFWSMTSVSLQDGGETVKGATDVENLYRLVRFLVQKGR